MKILKNKKEEIREEIRLLNKPKPGAKYVIYDDKEQYVYVDPCGWPVFDDNLYPRTTRFIKEEAKTYIKNLKMTGLKIKKVGN